MHLLLKVGNTADGGGSQVVWNLKLFTGNFLNRIRHRNKAIEELKRSYGCGRKFNLASSSRKLGKCYSHRLLKAELI